jgi:hypothetical protein
MTRVRSGVLTAVVALLVVGCAGPVGTAPAAAPPAAPAPPPGSVVPTAWIDAATAAWPDTDGRKDGVMVFGGPRQCVLGDQRVRVLDIELRWIGSGYGPLVPGPAGVYGQAAEGADAADGFVHLCRLSASRHPSVGAPSRAGGSVVLTRYPDAGALQGAVAAFRSRPDTPVQDNEITQLTSGRYTVDALRRWYPTNPQGAYEAMVVDEPQRTTVVLEVNSLSREDFEALSAQKAADALTDFLERSHAAPPPGPTPVPAWAGSVWEDAADSFHIAVAKGWAQDPAAGDPTSPTSVARFRKADRSGSLTVIPTALNDPLSLPDAAQQARVVSAQHDYTVVGEEPITLDDGRAAVRLDATHAGRHFTNVLVVTDTDLFQIIGSAPADRWDDAQPDVLQMARSFVAEP